MAIIRQCDGCGKTSEQALACIGKVLKRDYCADCQGRAEEFLLELENARKQVADAFKAQLAELRARYEAGGFKLPDVY